MRLTPSRRIATLAVVGVCLAGTLLLAGCGADDPPDAPPPPKSLQVVTADEEDRRLREYTLLSPALGAETELNVMLPRGYESGSRRYPVLYLLHGAGGDADFWDEVGLDTLLRDLPMIVVMPDGETGFYSDWFNEGNGGPPRWETYHVDELIPWVDAKFRTEPAERAVAGISMGGLGALNYAARNPGTFKFAGSYSGIVEAEPEPMATVLVATGRDPALLGPVWGAFPEHEDVWDAHNPIDLAPKLRGTELAISTGTGSLPSGPTDPVETEVRAMNEALHQRLRQLGIEHTWDLRPGVHDVPYWRAAMARSVPELSAALGASAGP
jgi:S-formylglutathione hydrolase FrmB